MLREQVQAGWHTRLSWPLIRLIPRITRMVRALPLSKDKLTGTRYTHPGHGERARTVESWEGSGRSILGQALVEVSPALVTSR